MNKDDARKEFWNLCYNYIDNKNLDDYLKIKKLIEIFKETDPPFYRLSMNVCKVLNIDLKEI